LLTEPIRDVYKTVKRSGEVVMATSKRSKQTREGLKRAMELGRRPGRAPRVSDKAILGAIRLGTKAGALKVGLSKSQFIKRRRALEAAAQDAP
jgi:hypothetical protein